MAIPTTRLFHLHYNVPDASAAERALAEFGLPLRRRFGRIRGEAVSLAPDDAVPDDFRHRLRTHRRGYADVTLAPGRELRFDHLGLCTREFDAVVERAEERGWSIRDPDGRRPFVVTPWGFRAELHRDGSAVESTLGDWRVARVSSVELRVSNPNEVRDGLDEVFGDVPGLAVRSGEHRAFVPRFGLDGDALGGRTFEAATLVAEEENRRGPR